MWSLFRNLSLNHNTSSTRFYSDLLYIRTRFSRTYIGAAFGLRGHYIHTVTMNRPMLQSLCVLAFCSTVLGAFSVQKFCENACNRGLGGNLCRCNGFHFAGKRTVLENILPVPNTYSSVNGDEPINQRIQAPSFTNDIQQQTPVLRRENLSRIDKIRDTQMIIQWLLNNIRLIK